jgi:hypothetical protein
MKTADGVTITGYKGRSTVVVIPHEIAGRPVTAIGEKAFEGKGLTHLVIPNTVTIIGKAAFSDNKIAEITVPDSVTTIEQSTFADNRSHSVSIGKNIKTIGPSSLIRLKAPLRILPQRRRRRTKEGKTGEIWSFVFL